MLEIKVPVYRNRKTLSIGIPCWRADIKPKFLVSLLSVTLDKDINVFDTYIAQNIAIDDARNQIVKNTKGDYILMVDPDMTFTTDDIKKLIGHNKDIIAGLFFKRNKPYTPLIFRKDEEKKKYIPIVKYKRGLIEVDGVGTGLILIKRSVFEKIQEPWFVYRNDKIGLSEDLNFCNIAQANGFKIFADTSVKIGHIGDYEITEKDFETTYAN